MATPITAGAGVFEARKLLAGEVGVDIAIAPLIVGMIAALVSGLAAIHFMLAYLRRRSLDVFVWYRVGLAAVVLVVWLSR
jgi:undecaprenyl-diphosphatase